MASLACLILIVGVLPEHCESFSPSSQNQLFSGRTTITSRAVIGRSAHNHNHNSDEPLPSVLFFQDDDRGNFENSSNSAAANSQLPIGSSAAMNEYDRDAEFYRRRNLEYYNSLQQLQQQDDYTFNDLSVSNQSKPNQKEPHHLSPSRNNQDMAEDTFNNVLKSSRSSFKNVEQLTFRLLNRQPLVALAIFLVSGALFAYTLGFFILEGYIDNLNPAENDAVPYWDEPEIHTIMRKP